MASGKNICECPVPPGGIVVCEADQLAICRIEGGRLRTECKSPPMPLRVGLDINRYFLWAMREITTQQQLSSSEIDIAMLRRGIYERHGQILATFRHPSSLVRIFPDLKDWPSLERARNQVDIEVRVPHGTSQEYYVNKNAQANGDHEVHVQGCSFFPDVENRIYLGQFSNCRAAITAAKKIYRQSNGCYYCIRDCHSS